MEIIYEGDSLSELMKKEEIYYIGPFPSCLLKNLKQTESTICYSRRTSTPTTIKPVTISKPESKPESKMVTSVKYDGVRFYYHYLEGEDTPYSIECNGMRYP